MKFLMDTDHISILQRQSGREFINLNRKLGQHQLGDIVLSIVSYHEQIMGCHNFINRARRDEVLVRG